jgi:hypothetical protein
MVALAFLRSYPDAFAVSNANAIFLGAFHERGKWAVHFRQVANGLPVVSARAFVLLTDEGMAAAFGSDFFPDGFGSPVPGMDASSAIALAASQLGTVPDASGETSADLVYMPAPGVEAFVPTLAWRVRFSSEVPLGEWEVFLDAHSGDLLGRRNLNHTLEVAGTVLAEAECPSYCDGYAPVPSSSQMVGVIGVDSTWTDSSGYFSVPVSGAGYALLKMELSGLWIDVDRSYGQDATHFEMVSPGSLLTISWDDQNSLPDERDAFINGNRAHDFLKTIDPGFVGMDRPVTTRVGRSDGYCPGNAWWDFADGSINLCAEQGAYANTGRISDVLYHEYGHGVTNGIYTAGGTTDPPNDMHEGNSDILANLMTGSSVIGVGYFDGDCVTGVRDSENTLQWPDDVVPGQPHTSGQILAGFHWDAWRELRASLPEAEADSVARAVWHYSRVLGLPQTFPDQVLWSFWADDVDGNLDNGTPHHEDLCVAATNHGFECPPVLVGVLISHTPLGHCPDTTSRREVVADIVSTEGPLDPSEVRLAYRVNGGAFQYVLMAPEGTQDRYRAELTELGGMGEVEYYLHAKDIYGNEGMNPAAAPGELHEFDLTVAYDDLESGGPGWTVGYAGDDATTGIWELVDPIGTMAQPENDATPDPGAMCFVTGQCEGMQCHAGCTLGCNDVDGGATTLLSPVFDVSWADNAKVKYERWYSNQTGTAPRTDIWEVEISNDGGGSWFNIEYTQEPALSWQSVEVDVREMFGTPGQVQVKFVASDTGDPSLVEAAVDEFRVLAGTGQPTGVADAVIATSALALSPAHPNPVPGTTWVDYALPARGAVSLSVYDVSGRLVRTLFSGVRESGTHRARWDGRDAHGAEVMAGVYFLRLATDDGALTRKMTVVR